MEQLPSYSNINHNLITNIHPVFYGRSVTERDILSWSVMAGLTVRIMMNIVQGRIRPNDMIISRIRRIFDEDTVQELIDDYDPFRNVEFRDKIPKYNYVVEHYYPVPMLESGNMIHCDDGRWLVISSTDRAANGVRIFSNGVPVAVLSDKDEVTVCYSLSAKPKEDKKRKIIDTIHEDERTRSFFSDDDLTPEREAVVDSIRDRLLDIAYRDD